MRDAPYTRLAIITPEGSDRETEQKLLELREVKADPIIKVENGVEKFGYMFPVENSNQGQNNLVDLAHTLRGYDVIVSTEDRSSFSANVNNWHDSTKHLGTLKGVTKQFAKTQKLYLYDPQKENYFTFS